MTGLVAGVDSSTQSCTVVVRMVPRFRRMQTMIDEVNRVLREQLGGIRVVRAFVREPLETTRFGRANADLTAVATSAGRLQALIFPVVLLVLNVSSVAVLWFGGLRVDAGQMQIGALTAFLAYLLQILMRGAGAPSPHRRTVSRTPPPPPAAG